MITPTIATTLFQAYGHGVVAAVSMGLMLTAAVLQFSGIVDLKLEKHAETEVDVSKANADSKKTA